MAANALTLEQQLSLHRLDETSRRDIRTAWKVIQPKMVAILREFYDHIGAFPPLAEKVSAHTDHLIKVQARHWEHLFSAKFDSDYVDSVRRIGLAHVRQNISPGWYIAGYGFLINRIMTELGAAKRFNGPAAVRISGAFMRAAMLDLDISITLYHDKQVEMVEQRRHGVNAAASEFDAVMSSSITAISNATERLNTMADELGAAAEGSSDKAATVSDIATSIAGMVAETAAATEQLSASIAEIGTHASRSHAIASTAVQKAEHTDISVRGLAETADRIGSVVEMISDIAAQTNLLALNATIEAARAGEAGRGFAVVAQEVKQLAEQTGKATGEIARQVTAIQEATHKTVDDLAGISTTIKDVSAAAQSIASAVEEQTAVTRQLAEAAGRISMDADGLTEAVIGVGEATRATEGTASSVRDLARTLEEQADALGTQSQDFFQRLRSA